MNTLIALLTLNKVKFFGLVDTDQPKRSVNSLIKRIFYLMQVAFTGEVKAPTDIGHSEIHLNTSMNQPRLNPFVK